MAKIKVTQTKSGIDRPLRQKRTLIALGLKHPNHTVEVETTPQVKGMLAKVMHLVRIQE